MLTRRRLLAGAMAGAGSMGLSKILSAQDSQIHGHEGAPTPTIRPPEEERTATQVLPTLRDPESGPLPIPYLMDAREYDNKLHLAAAASRHRFAPNFFDSATYGYNGDYLGPTIRVHRGDSVEIAVENRLLSVTTTHWHGLMVPSWLDGGPHNEIQPCETWAPELEIDQPEATLWYHAHPHHDTGRQVYMGLCGMMIVEDGTGERLGLPHEYGVDDIPIIMQDRVMTNRGELHFGHFAREQILGIRGDLLVINGAVSPVATVPAGLVRLRLLNAANARNFHLHFSDDREFHVIASDVAYLEAPVAMTSLTVSPGERFEILVDFSDGAEVTLETLRDPIEPPQRTPGLGALTQNSPAGNPRSGAGTMMHFQVDASLQSTATEIPASLIDIPPPDVGSIVRRREMTLDMWPGFGGGVGEAGGEIGPGGVGHRPGTGPAMGINGKVFDMNRIDFETELGTSEIWEVTGFLMPHPFHAHGTHFRVLSLDGAPPPPHLAGWKDTVLLQGTTEVLVRFDGPATEDFPFMVHCHMFDHEDGGMMAQFTVI